MTNRLAEFRRLRGLSQKQLAAAAGTSVVNVSRLETGQRKLNEENVMPFARALGVQPGDLMPLVTDGSISMRGKLASVDKNVMAVAMARFMEIHTDYDADACSRLGMASVKFYLGAMAGVEGQPYFDFQSLVDNLAPDQNTDEEEGS